MLDSGPAWTESPYLAEPLTSGSVSSTTTLVLSSPSREVRRSAAEIRLRCVQWYDELRQGPIRDDGSDPAI